MLFRIERWRVQPTEPPRIWRHCSGCRSPRAFACSERFRMNAQKKIIDVWLIYRCESCDATWNRPVLSRCSVADIEGESFDAFERNDCATARRYAFDVASLRSQVMRVETSEQLRIEREPLREPCEHGYTIRIVMPLACDVRLDRLLANELSMARGDLQRRHSAGTLLVAPTRRDPLRRPIHDGQEICLVGG
jgi:hypothetical protein